MGPDNEEDGDELLNALNAETGDELDEQGQLPFGEEDAPAKDDSVRDSIRKAIKEEALPWDEKDEQRNKNLEKAREVKKLKRPTLKSDSEVDTNKDVLVKNTSGEADVDKDVSTPQSDLQPPNGWTKEAKASWNKLPDYIKQSVAKREKEVSEGFKKYGEDTKRLKELDAVIAPRREAIQRFGVSEAQTVDRLFQWMDSLTGPNKLNSWLMLGQNFGINVNEILKQAGATPTNPNEQQPKAQENQIPDPIKQYVESAVGSVNQYVQQQKQEAANSFLTNWSKDKPHFNKLRSTMYALLNSNAIPQKDGQLDLDTAYEYACNADPETRAELAAASVEAAEKKAAEDKQKSDAARIVKLNAARRAGSSIKPTAPSGGNRAIKPAKGNGRAISVRESLAESIAELANN